MADFANNPELRKWANQLFTPKRTDGGFAARSLVCLGGLKSAPELNGRMAMVVREMDSGGRMTVTLSGEMKPVPFGALRDSDFTLVASAGLLFALVAAGAWDLGAARATGFAAVVTAIAWVFVL